MFWRKRFIWVNSRCLCDQILPWMFDQCVFDGVSGYNMEKPSKMRQYSAVRRQIFGRVFCWWRLEQSNNFGARTGVNWMTLIISWKKVVYFCWGKISVQILLAKDLFRNAPWGMLNFGWEKNPIFKRLRCRMPSSFQAWFVRRGGDPRASTGIQILGASQFLRSRTKGVFWWLWDDNGTVVATQIFV